MRRDMGTPSSPLGHTTLSRLLLYTVNAICVRDDYTLVLVTLREKTGCQQTIIEVFHAHPSQLSPLHPT